MNPEVSVIVPVYNGEKYLRRNVESILNQTLRNIEVIFVDDGSSDASPAILREYAEKDNRVTVIEQKNAGAGAARNNGMRQAKGEYLSFLDSDDFFEPDLLAKAYERAKACSADVVVYRCDFYYTQENRYDAETATYTIVNRLLPQKEVFAGTEVPQNIFGAFVGWPWDKLFRTEYIREIGLHFQEQRTTNDLLFVYAALARADRIAILEDILVHQRRNVSGSLSVTREKSWDCCYRALCALRQTLTDWGMFEHYERDFVNYSVAFLRWNIDTLAEPTKSKLLKILREEWFENLGVCGRKRSYFYSEDMYMTYLNVMRGIYGEPKEQYSARQRLVWSLQDHGFCGTVKKMAEKLQKNKTTQSGTTCF